MCLGSRVSLITEVSEIGSGDGKEKKDSKIIIIIIFYRIQLLFRIVFPSQQQMPEPRVSLI